MSFCAKAFLFAVHWSRQFVSSSTAGRATGRCWASLHRLHSYCEGNLRDAAVYASPRSMCGGGKTGQTVVAKRKGDCEIGRLGVKRSRGVGRATRGTSNQRKAERDGAGRSRGLPSFSVIIEFIPARRAILHPSETKNAGKGEREGERRRGAERERDESGSRASRVPKSQ